MILVTGATGNVGAELVRALSRADEPVRGLVRRPDHQLPAGVHAAAGDLNQPDSLRDALQDVKAVFLLSGYNDMPALLAQMQDAGTERVVLLSGGGAAATDVNNAVSRYQLQSEEAVQDSGLDWTILRPYGFMSNTLQWAPQVRSGEVVRAPFAHVPVASIDPYDIATVAAVALRSDEHAGETFRLSGPEALLPADRARILGSALGRELRFEAQPNDEARAEMNASMPVEYVDAFFGFYVDGTLDETQPLPTVQQLTAAEPRHFEQWVAAHLDAFH